MNEAQAGRHDRPRVLDHSMPEMRLDRAYRNVFDSAEADHLASLQGDAEVFGPRQRLVRANVPLTQSYYLTRGFVGRTRIDRAGRRQFLALQIPGDYIDLPAFVLDSLDHDLVSITDAALRPTPHGRIAAMRDNQPVLFQKLWRVSMIDSAIHRYWIYRLGRLSGRARIANFFSEMLVRLYARDLGTLHGFPLPLTQTDVAEICGITAVHANRLIAELRGEGTCAFGGGEVAVSDPVALFRTGQFAWDYLYLPAGTDAELRGLPGMKHPR